ncbi:flavin reductase family protein [Nocardia pseudovaccinii]|uniref:flavin reductase family protein n=1 Tax=Nocardia pseudovaccinii TaxID=189540 RepID=UPI0007C8516C|nr:flavin reductase family protein [Nocardia pseudovaccinii]
MNTHTRAPAPLLAEDDSGLDPAECVRLYRKLAAGVSIVSALSHTGPVGLTASTVTSLSLRPPLLLVCLAAGSYTLSAIQDRGRFGVQLLADHQRQVAQDFASATGTRFTDSNHSRIHDVPILDATLGWSVCRLTDAREYGDHVLVVGQVVAAGTGLGRPLIWHSQRFADIADAAHDKATRDWNGDLWNGT